MFTIVCQRFAGWLFCAVLCGFNGRAPQFAFTVCQYLPGASPVAVGSWAWLALEWWRVVLAVGVYYARAFAVGVSDYFVNELIYRRLGLGAVLRGLTVAGRDAWTVAWNFGAFLVLGVGVIGGFYVELQYLRLFRHVWGGDAT